jgi:hypothetical protein
MYHNCIFCSADLKANDVLERFPVGGMVAFDGEKGRLWAVCPGCARWNLAPLEERWEALEDAERLFHDTRTRVQSENVGLARMPDGTRLVRIGGAPPGEMAFWRYGRQLARRRGAPGWLAVPVVSGLAIAGVTLSPAVLPALGLVGAHHVWKVAQSYRRAGRVAHRVPAQASPAGRDLFLTWRDLALVRTGVDEAGGLVLDLLPPDDPLSPVGTGMTVAGAEARAVLGKALLGINRDGARDTTLRYALEMIDDAGGTEAFLAREAAERWSLGRDDVEVGEAFPTFRALGRRMAHPFSPPPPAPGRLLAPLKQLNTTPTRAVALEMVLHEETERRAMEGELAALEAAWRQAEEIAAIADRLPDVPAPEPPRLGRPTG